MTPGRERQQRYRARRRRAGTRRLDLWLDAEAQALVAELQQPGERLDELLLQALQTLLRLLFPEDQPVYPRRAYGLRTLPLAALNAFLARHGYVLHAAKVRNRDWVVSATDRAGQTEVFGLFEWRRIDGEPRR